MPKKQRFDFGEPEPEIPAAGPDYPPWIGIDKGAMMYNEPYIPPAPTKSDWQGGELMHSQRTVPTGGGGPLSGQAIPPTVHKGIITYLMHLLGGGGR